MVFVNRVNVFIAAAFVLAAAAGCEGAKIPSQPSRHLTVSVSISKLAPHSALVDSRTPVQISGYGFMPGVIVRFGDLAGEVLSVSPTAIRVNTPERGLGNVTVSVENPDGSRASYPIQFAFRHIGFRGLAPDRGIVTILAQLHLEQFPAGSRVKFGDLEANVTVSQNGAIFVRAPDNGAVAGPVDVAIIRPDGQVETLPGAFTYQTVAVTPGTLTITAGAPLTVTWNHPSAWYNDFFEDSLELHRVGHESGAIIWRRGIGMETGSATLAAPLEPGTYEFRFMVGGGGVLAGRSPAVTVTSPGG